MSLSKKLKKAGFWQLAEIFALVVCQFAYFSIMARLLEKSDFGLMAIVNSLAVFGNIFAEGGMGAALIQQRDVTYKHINAALQGALVIGILFAVLLSGFAPLAAAFFEQPSLTPLIQVISLTFILQGISGVSLGLMQKNFQFKQAAMVSFISVTVGYSIGVIMGYYGYGAWSLVVATVVYSFLKAVGCFLYAPIKLSAKLYIDEWKSLFSFGSGMILLKICNYFGTGGVNLVLGKIFAPATLGVFERAFQLKNLPTKHLGNVLNNVMFPAMSEIQDEEDKLFKVYEHGLGVSNAILMPVAVFFIFFAPEIVYILLGKDWTEAILPLQIMLIILPFSISSRMADSTIRAKGLIYKNVNRKLIYVGILIITSAIGAIYYGLVGAAIAVTISYLINYVLMILLVKGIFNKSFKQIFYRPLKEAFVLSLGLIIILLLYNLLFDLWGKVRIDYFLMFSSVLACGVVIIAIKKPLILGHYIKITIKNLRNKKGKKLA